MEIEVRRSRILLAALWAGLTALLGGLGYAVSPSDPAGHPVLLMPDVRAVETYRRRAREWASEWRALDTRLTALPSEAAEGAGLLAASQSAESAVRQSIELARRIDGQEAPAAMVGLQEQARTTADAFVAASLASARWLSAPTPGNRAAADLALIRATAALSVLNANAWVATTDLP